ncbi:MAG: HD domain-containing protein, partial [Chromatiales bacterium]|nr:HD domain-containing protein [Chromatiales bacterium]
NNYEREIILIILLGTLLVLFFIWWVIHRWLIQPIQTLGSVTHDIANGRLSSRVDTLGKDEIGELGDSINKMATSIEELFTEQEEAHLQMLQSLAKALEAKDAYTASHSGRVAKFSVQLGRQLGLPDDQIKLLKQGALTHDLGKIGIADSILNKTSALSDNEYEVMKLHPMLTATIMRPLKRFKAFADIAAWHHERWDGKGYPDGLAGENIPLLARIVAIADTWDAMTGTRVYRKGMSTEKALSILVAERDLGQWDPTLIDLFIALIGDEVEARSRVVDDIERASKAAT